MFIVKPNIVAAAALAALLAGCTTSGNDGVLGSAAVAPEDGTQVAAVEPGENPNAGTRLKNTRNALTDYCPAVRIRAGTEAYRVVPDGADKSDSDNVRYQATITKVARECAYEGDELSIRVGARGRAITGPEGKSGTFKMPIRVAVTRGDETVYSKLFRPDITIASGTTSEQFSFVDDQLRIPAPTETNVRVYIGFDEGPYDTR